MPPPHRSTPPPLLTHPTSQPPPVVCRLGGTGLSGRCRVSTQTELLWLSEQQDKTHPARVEPIGVPQEQSAPSGDSALAAVISQDLISWPNLLCSLFPCSCETAPMMTAALFLSGGGDRMFMLACPCVVCYYGCYDFLFLHCVRPCCNDTLWKSF